MRLHKIFLGLMFSLFSAAALAGAGHDHGHSHDPVTQAQAEKAAVKNISRLIDKGKIDASWSSVKVAKSEKKKFGKKLEWVVTFENKQITDPKKQILYIFLSLEGGYLAANYTGK